MFFKKLAQHCWFKSAGSGKRVKMVKVHVEQKGMKFESRYVAFCIL